jgi:hypothetical protein
MLKLSNVLYFFYFLLGFIGGLVADGRYQISTLKVRGN